MTDGALPLTPRELLILATPSGMVRILWRRFYRNLRLYVRAEMAQRDHEFLYGTGDRSKEPVGIIHAAGLQQGAR